MVIIVFLAAYSIPVTFGSVMSVLGSNQLANLLSFTPGRRRRQPGVQHVRPRQLHGARRRPRRTRVGQQLITTAFNVVFAIVLVCVVFGWSGGSKLVKDSYGDAKVKAGEMKANRSKGLDAIEGESGDA